MRRSSTRVSVAHETHEASLIGSPVTPSCVESAREGEYPLRCKLLEQELSLCLAAGQRAEEAHIKELEKLEEQTDRYAKDRHTLMNKLQQISLVENIIKDLYIQMKVRIDKKDPTYEEIEKEKQNLKGENIFIVLRDLHATLQHLWQFKIEAERDFKNMRSRREKDLIQNIGNLKLQTVSLVNALEEERGQRASVGEELEHVTKARDELKKISFTVTQEMEQKYKSLIDELKKSEKEKKRLSDLLQISQKEGRRRDALILELQRLREEKSNRALRHERELNRLKYMHCKEIEEIKKHDRELINVRRENQRLKFENEELKRTVKSLETNYRMTTIHNLEAKIVKLENQLRQCNGEANIKTRLPVQEAKKPKTPKPRPHSAVPQRVVRFEDDEEPAVVWMKDDMETLRNNVLEKIDIVKATLKSNPFEQDHSRK